MNELFKDLETAKAITMPIAMRHALRLSTPTGVGIPYDPSTQMSVFGGDAANMFGPGSNHTQVAVPKPSRNTPS